MNMLTTLMTFIAVTAHIHVVLISLEKNSLVLVISFKEGYMYTIDDTNRS